MPPAAADSSARKARRPNGNISVTTACGRSSAEKLQQLSAVARPQRVAGDAVAGRRRRAPLKSTSRATHRRELHQTRTPDGVGQGPGGPPFASITSAPCSANASASSQRAAQVAASRAGSGPRTGSASAGHALAGPQRYGGPRSVSSTGRRQIVDERALGIVAYRRLAQHVPAQGQHQGGPQDALVGDHQTGRARPPARSRRQAREPGGDLARALAAGRPEIEARHPPVAHRRGQLGPQLGQRAALERAPAHLGSRRSLGGSANPSRAASRARGRAGSARQGASAKPSGRRQPADLRPAGVAQRDVGAALDAAVLVPAVLAVPDQADAHAASAPADPAGASLGQPRARRPRRSCAGQRSAPAPARPIAAAAPGPRAAQRWRRHAPPVGAARRAARRRRP